MTLRAYLSVCSRPGTHIASYGPDVVRSGLEADEGAREHRPVRGPPRTLPSVLGDLHQRLDLCRVDPAERKDGVDVRRTGTGATRLQPGNLRGGAPQGRGDGINSQAGLFAMTAQFRA
jgi:hypothetical protein